jgi:hypothetical protein
VLLCYSDNLLLEVQLRNTDMHEAVTTFVCLCRKTGAGYVPYWNMIQTHILRLDLYVLYIPSFFIFSSKKRALLGKSDSINVRILMEMKMIIVFCVITLCNLVVLCQCFGGKCYLSFQ